MSDMVGHPPHYTSSATGVECIEISEELPFCLGNALKYVWRAGLKDSELLDLEKACWYVRREVARLANKECLERPPLSEPLLKYLAAEKDTEKRGLVIMITSGIPALLRAAVDVLERKIERLKAETEAA